MTTHIGRLAVLTSGGDAPGMNAAIRAVVRTASASGVAVVGIQNGYAGLLAGDVCPLDDRSVAGIMQSGGTILGTVRCPTFREVEQQRAAIATLDELHVDGLMVIGGNGSQQGSLALHRLGLPTIGIASTIDNDLAETETTIGVDTALNTAMECIDKLKTTATSHHRAFIVEVMGRRSGYLALMAGIATGAELAVVPEREITAEAIAEDVQRQYARGKRHYLVVAAEGAALAARDLTEYLCAHPCAFEARLSVLGHVQRGGSPTVFDRTLASRLGSAAVDALLAGQRGVVMGWKGKPSGIPLELAVGSCQKVTPELLRLAETLAR
jgi:6-phosphofructokinase 1